MDRANRQENPSKVLEKSRPFKQNQRLAGQNVLFRRGFAPHQTAVCFASPAGRFAAGCAGLGRGRIGDIK
jgi:hypothetical protein